LDHATTGLIPEYSLKVMYNHLTHRFEEGIRISEFWDLWEQADSIRNLIGKMINCSEKEVIYGSSSTQLFNIFSNGISLKSGDNIVTTDSVYPANAYVWLNKKYKGIELRFAKTHYGKVFIDELFSLVDRRTRAVSICMVDNKTGYRHDIKRIGEMCRIYDIPLIVDATQATNAFQIDVKKMNIDFLTTSIYKWLLSPLGLGFAYINKDFSNQLNQNSVGWVGTINRRNNKVKQLRLSNEARRFETGGINFLALFGMAEVINRYLKLTGERIEERIILLVNYLYSRIVELNKIRLYNYYPLQNRSGIVLLYIPRDINITYRKLEKYNIRARIITNKLLRVSLHYMNNKKDVDTLISALKNIENKK